MAFNSSMPMFWGDYLRDTARLSPAEHGAYLMLIAEQWSTGKPLPDDDTRLSRIAKMSPREWKVARKILEPFFVVADGQWTQKRVARELEKARETYDRRVAAGSKGGRPAKAEVKPGLRHPQPGPQQPEPDPNLEPGLLGEGVESLSQENWHDLAERASALAELARAATPLHSGIARQWAADGVTRADLTVIADILARERDKRDEPGLVLPLAYYTRAVMEARHLRLADTARADDLRNKIEKWKRGDDAN